MKKLKTWWRSVVDPVFGFKTVTVEVFPLLSDQPREVGVRIRNAPFVYGDDEILEIQESIRQDLETWVKYLGRNLSYRGETFRITLTPDGLTLTPDPPKEKTFTLTGGC